MPRFVPTLTLMLIAALSATAQDRQGRDTPGDWIVTHHKAFGLWDSICDERVERAGLIQRCYLRYVDVFSPRPKFAAQFLFVTPEGVEIGTERGTRFDDTGMRIEGPGGTPLHVITEPGCLRGGACRFAGAQAATLLDHMRRGHRFAFDFRDRHGARQSLSWSLTTFGAAYDRYRAEARARGLLP